MNSRELTNPPSETDHLDLDEELFEDSLQRRIPVTSVSNMRLTAVTVKEAEPPHTFLKSMEATAIHRLLIVLAAFLVTAVVAFAGWHFSSPPESVSSDPASGPMQSGKENRGR